MDTEKYNIEISVQSQYLDTQSTPENNRYVFAYNVTIINKGKVPARLLSRHWVITDAEGKVQEVRGSGVIGEHPYLKPGENFNYSSGSIIETPIGSMHGSYQMRADDGTEFDAEINPFSLHSNPQSLH